MIGYVDMSDDDKRVIFRTILDNFLSTGFEAELARYAARDGLLSFSLNFLQLWSSAALTPRVFGLRKHLV